MEFAEELSLYIRTGAPLIYVTALEVERAVLSIQNLCKEMQNVPACKVWRNTTGWGEDGDNAPDDVPDRVSGFEENTVCVLVNFHWYIGENADVIRIQQLIDGYYIWKGDQPRTVIVLSPSYQVAPELDRLFQSVTYTLPPQERLREALTSIIEAQDGAVPTPEPEEELKVLEAAAGLTEDEFENAVTFSILKNPDKKVDASIVMDEKAKLLTKTGYLDIWPNPDDLSAVGGMENLKDWLTRREQSLGPEAREFGLPYPKGMMLLGVPGTGKCHGKDTPILMYDGTIKMVQDIKIGELVMGDDSTSRVVLSTTKGKGPLYRVVPVKGDSYIVNENHILSLRLNLHGKEDTVNLSVLDYLKKPSWFKARAKGYRTLIEFPKKEITLHPYFLGLWLGDGTSNFPMITTVDEEIVTFLKDYAREWGLEARDIQPNKSAGHYSLSTGQHGGRHDRNALLNEMTRLELRNNKHIPLDFLANSQEMRLELLAGLIDSDGYVDRKNKVVEITTKWSNLRDDILYLVRSLGLAAYSSEKTVKGKVYHRIGISGELSDIPTKIARKRNIEPRQQKKNVLRTGIMVESIGVGNFYGFELDGNQLYCLGDFTVTHNSLVAKCVAKQWGLQLVRFDIGKVFGSLVGQSEERMRMILLQVEALSPCVLWIDEAEKGLAGAQNTGNTDSGVTKRIFGTLISWMQERPKDKLIYMVMTVNDIVSLPSELLRKGRFDEIFWVDLPNDDEKLEILKIHLTKRGRLTPTLEKDLPNLMGPANGFSGAELEVAVEDSMFEVFFNGDTEITTKDLKTALESTIPLSKTRATEIEGMREWAKTRTKPAQKITTVKTGASRKRRMDV